MSIQLNFLIIRGNLCLKSSDLWEECPINLLLVYIFSEFYFTYSIHRICSLLFWMSSDIFDVSKATSVRFRQARHDAKQASNVFGRLSLSWTKIHFFNFAKRIMSWLSSLICAEFEFETFFAYFGMSDLDICCQTKSIDQNSKLRLFKLIVALWAEWWNGSTMCRKTKKFWSTSYNFNLAFSESWQNLT